MDNTKSTNGVNGNNNEEKKEEIKKVQGSTYILTLGFQITANDEQYSFENFKNAYSEIYGEIKLPIYKQYELLKYKPYREYISSDYEEDFSESAWGILQHINSIKHNILTSKAARGFIHVLINEYKNINLYKYEYTGKGDIKSLESSITVNITVFLYLELDKTGEDENIEKKEEKILPSAAMTMLIEPCENDKTKTSQDILETFLRNKDNNYRSRLYLKLDDIKKLPDILKAFCHQKKIQDIELGLNGLFQRPHKELGNDNLVSINEFLLGLIWVKAKGLVRYKKYGQQGQRQEPFKTFIKYASDLYNLQTYNVALLDVDEIANIQNNPLVNTLFDACPLFMIDESMNTDQTSSLLSIIKGDKNGKDTVTFLPTQKKEAFFLFQNNTVVFFNKAIFSATELQPENGGQEGAGYYYPRYELLSWLIIYSEMLCNIVNNFIIYNTEIEKHMRKKENNETSFNILRQALQDFDEYYGLNIINTPEYNNIFNFAKKQMKIDDYYNVLKDKVTLFSGYEIGKKNESIENSILFLTFALVILTIVSKIIKLSTNQKWTIWEYIVFVGIVLIILYSVMPYIKSIPILLRKFFKRKN